MIPEREPEKWLPHPRKAAAAKIPPLQFADGVTRNNNLGSYGLQNWNENNVNSLMRTNWRASLVPVAVVILAPIAYTKVAAVKKLVVEPQGCTFGLPALQAKLSVCFF